MKKVKKVLGRENIRKFLTGIKTVISAASQPYIDLYLESVKVIFHSKISSGTWKFSQNTLKSNKQVLKNSKISKSSKKKNHKIQKVSST